MKNKVITLVVGSVRTNTYIYYNEENRHGVIIDPGAEAGKILTEAKAHNLDIKGILLTHGHFDHTKAADELRNALNIPIYASEEDAALANDPALCGTAAFKMKPITVTVDKILRDNEELDFGFGKIQVLHTPGHTHGSVCLYAPDDDIIFTGDCLFKESYGRYDFPTGKLSALKNSLQRLFDILPEKTVVYPGHMEATTMGHEKLHNPIGRQ